MNMTELDHAMRKLRLGGMASTLEVRLIEAQSEKQAPIDLISALVSDELLRRQDRLLERRLKKARFRDPDKTLDGFDFGFAKKLNRKLLFELATPCASAMAFTAATSGKDGSNSRFFDV